jgi:hypothetical protein
MLLEDYIEYFKNIAVTHPDLLHEDDLGKRIFALTIEQALSNFRSGFKEKGFYMRPILYTYSVEGNKADDPRKKPMGGFIVARYHRPGKFEEYIEALSQSERIVDDILERINADSLNGHPLFYGSQDTLTDIEITPSPYSGDVNYSGWLCTFTFHNFFRACLEHPDSPAWTDGGLTPF